MFNDHPNLLKLMAKKILQNRPFRYSIGRNNKVKQTEVL